MTHVTATIAQKAEPAMGKKRGRIKDTAGTVYQITPALAQMVNVGQSYDLDYKDEEFNGMKYRVVESIMPAAGGPPAPLPGAIQRVQHPSQVIFPDAMVSVNVVSQAHKEELIAGEAILKCCQPAKMGDQAALEHGLKAAILAYRTIRRWQLGGNIESGPRDEYE